MPNSHGFSLIELLLVIAVIAILAGVLLTGGLAIREGARRGQAAALVALLHQAAQTYRAEELRGRFPVADTAGVIEFAPSSESAGAPRVGDLLERVGFSRSQGRTAEAAGGARRLLDPWLGEAQYRVDAVIDGTPDRPLDEAGQMVQVPGDASDWNPAGRQPYAYVWSWGPARAGQRLKANIARWIYVRQTP